MPTCEKCWADAYFLAFNSNVDQGTIYRSLLKSRAEEGKVCSPEEQCGDLHIVIDRHCICGAKKE